VESDHTNTKPASASQLESPQAEKKRRGRPTSCGSSSRAPVPAAGVTLGTEVERRWRRGSNHWLLPGGGEHVVLPPAKDCVRTGRRVGGPAGGRAGGSEWTVSVAAWAIPYVSGASGSILGFGWLGLGGELDVYLGRLSRDRGRA
jgi:hypothetical protein